VPGGGHGSCGDDGIGSGDARVQHFLLFALFLICQLSRIAAGAIGADAVSTNFAPSDFTCSLVAPSDVIRSTTAPRRRAVRDGLQAGHPGANHEQPEAGSCRGVVSMGRNFCRCAAISTAL